METPSDSQYISQESHPHRVRYEENVIQGAV